MRITYTGDEPISQPGLGLTWVTGDTHEVPDALGDAWDNDPDAPFSGARKKAAKEAQAQRAASPDAPPPVEQHPTPTPLIALDPALLPGTPPPPPAPDPTEQQTQPANAAQQQEAQ